MSNYELIKLRCLCDEALPGCYQRCSSSMECRLDILSHPRGLPPSCHATHPARSAINIRNKLRTRASNFSCAMAVFLAAAQSQLAVMRSVSVLGLGDASLGFASCSAGQELAMKAFKASAALFLVGAGGTWSSALPSTLSSIFSSELLCHEFSSVHRPEPRKGRRCGLSQAPRCNHCKFCRQTLPEIDAT